MEPIGGMGGMDEMSGMGGMGGMGQLGGMGGQTLLKLLCNIKEVACRLLPFLPFCNLLPLCNFIG